MTSVMTINMMSPAKHCIVINLCFASVSEIEFSLKESFCGLCILNAAVDSEWLTQGEATTRVHHPRIQANHIKMHA